MNSIWSSPYRGPGRRVVAGACAAVLALPILTAAQQVIFRSSVDLVAVDTQVIDREGTPIGSLASKNFQVWINGQSRKVVSADLITYPLTAPRSLTKSLFDEPDLIRSDVPEVNGRVFILVVDEMSFSTQALPAVIQTAKKFLGILPAEDVVGLYAYPFGPARLDLTHYHNSVGLSLNRLQGLRQSFPGEFELSPSEAIDIASGDSFAYTRVFDRMCKVPVNGVCTVVDLNCGLRVHAEADAYVNFVESVSAQSFSGLRDLLHNLNGITGPKTVVLLSAGLMTADRVGGRPDVGAMMQVAGKYAAAADASVYALHIDDTYLETSSPMGPSMHGSSCADSPGEFYTSQVRDARLNAYGLERVAGEANGTYIHVAAGTGELALNRVLKETSAYYVLGVQPEGVDRDGRVHFIRVKAVDVKNATVRARAQVTIPKPSAK